MVFKKTLKRIHILYLKVDFVFVKQSNGKSKSKSREVLLNRVKQQARRKDNELEFKLTISHKN